MRDRVSEREGFRISAIHFYVTGDVEKEGQTYELWTTDFQPLRWRASHSAVARRLPRSRGEDEFGTTTYRTDLEALKSGATAPVAAAKVARDLVKGAEPKSTGVVYLMDSTDQPLRPLPKESVSG